MDNICRNNFVLTKCTVCHKITEEIYEHSVLKVIICKGCFDEVNPILADLGNRCYWCTQERELLQCVQCQYQCCYECINTNLGTDYINILNEKNWMCFVCDSSPIEHLQNEFLQLNEIPVNEIPALSPEGAGSSGNICSPYVNINKNDDSFKRTNRRKSTTSQDLDSILNMYEKQIQASLELDDANVPAIINEIKSIQTDQLSAAINSFKKCLSAFTSDLNNLELRVAQAKSSNNQITLAKLTSLLQILVQHHIFNRLSHPKSRIRDEKLLSSSANGDPSNVVIIPPVPNQSQKMVLIMDQNWLKDPNKFQVTLEKVAIDLNQSKPLSENFTMKDLSKVLESNKRHHSMSTIDQNKQNQKSGLKDSNSPDGNSSICSSSKKQKRMFDQESNESSSELKISRQRRSLVVPSWLNDFKVEREYANQLYDDTQETDDQDWTDYRIKMFRNGLQRKRGRPPKSPSFQRLMSSNLELDSSTTLKRGRGRPKKTETLNDKQPRYYIPKLNGDALQSIEYNI